MINILLLSAGTNACYHIARVLKNKFPLDFRIIGADINEEYLIPTIPYLDAFHKVPYTNNPLYYGKILDILKEEKIDYILPSFDADQKIFFPENKDLIDLGVTSFGTNLETLEFYSDKNKMYDFLQSKNLPLPKRYSLSEINKDLIYFIKPVNGVGSVGARQLKGSEIINLSDIDNYIIQEICSEPEYTLECFSYADCFSAVCRERLATKAGVCVKTKIYKNTELENIGKQFAKNVKTPYIFNLQFMKNSQNEYVITDVNLRTAGGMSLSYAAGWDEVSALAKIMSGASKDEIFSSLPENIAEQYVVRAYTDIVTKTTQQVIAFDLDGTLLDSRKRHQIVMNFVLDKLGIALDSSDLIEFKRGGKNNIDFLTAKGIDKEIAQNIQQEWIKHIEDEEFLASDILYPETLEILQKYIGYDRILITARNNKKNALKQIQKLGLSQYFKEIFVVPSNKETSIKKADILRQNHAKLFIGDTKSDYLAALNAGIEFKHFNKGFHNKEYVNG